MERLFPLQKTAKSSSSASPFIVGYHGTAKRRSALGDLTNPYLVLDWEKNGDLEHLLAKRADGNKLSINDIKKYTASMVLGLEKLHSKRIAHLDLKPGNLLIGGCGRVLKITDFGIARAVPDGDNTIEDPVGTPAYMAPELFQISKYDPFRADTFSLGVILYEMLYHHIP